jgi:hypothetical protein
LEPNSFVIPKYSLTTAMERDREAEKPRSAALCEARGELGELLRHEEISTKFAPICSKVKNWKEHHLDYFYGGLAVRGHPWIDLEIDCLLCV